MHHDDKIDFDEIVNHGCDEANGDDIVRFLSIYTSPPMSNPHSSSFKVFRLRFRPILTLFVKYNSLPRPLCIVTDSTDELAICLSTII